MLYFRTSSFKHPFYLCILLPKSSGDPCNPVSKQYSGPRILFSTCTSSSITTMLVRWRGARGSGKAVKEWAFMHGTCVPINAQMMREENWHLPAMVLLSLQLCFCCCFTRIIEWTSSISSSLLVTSCCHYISKRRDPVHLLLQFCSPRCGLLPLLSLHTDPFPISSLQIYP